MKVVNIYLSRLANSPVIWICFSEMLIFCFDACIVSILIFTQANPPDPKRFPFILLGNKIDIDGGNSRVVRKHIHSAVHDLPMYII